MSETQKVKRPDPEIARRALEEARARRVAIDARTSDAPTEIDGRGGLDPARYGDWEIKGISSDF
ncbi:MAG TPA: DUF1674 domain-containing protein [Pelagibacterium sp.]|uniref:DUF1674 domain-containing protein n=1 Tax=Pelagibacterium sp. TaxID=1967288 RepID=UPI002C57ED0D|nr:DUF1674 domain-containing protein [Pelagibacterium sp.]HWJ87328.1 DUF1674 domain-containing protein [Pelagibacterium sp.]